jgi:hypothetical protein
LDVPPSPGPSSEKSLPSSRPHHSSSIASRPASGSQSLATTDAPTRSRSLSVSLAQEKEKERAATVGVVQDKTLQRALTREISMSRAWKGKERSATVVSQTDAKAAATANAKGVLGRTDPQSQSSQSRAALAITLVTATPVKKPPPRTKSNTLARSSSPIPMGRSSSVHTTGRSSSPHLTGRSSSPPTARSSSLTPLEADDDEPDLSSHPLHDSPDSLGNARDDDDEDMWLPNSSPDVLLLGPSGWSTGARKRVPSGASETAAPDTPVRKRMKLGR